MLAGTGRSQKATLANRSSTEGWDGLAKAVTNFLTRHVHVDFSVYKPEVVQEVARRRMALNKFTEFGDYTRFLDSAPDELDALVSELLGPRPTFSQSVGIEALKRQVLRKLFSPSHKKTVRLWVPGCCDGPEAYSVAMALAEVGGPMLRTLKPKLYATDVGEALLQQARSGLFASERMANVSPKRLSRFFTQEGTNYRANGVLRDAIVFARHVLWTDPPFSQMDVISCGNLLKYLRPEIQEKVLGIFHYALNSAGILLLSEFEKTWAPGALEALFDTVDAKRKIFRKRRSARTTHRHVWGAMEKPGQARSGPSLPLAYEMYSTELKTRDEAIRVTLSRYAPPGVLIDPQLHILRFSGDTTPYLRPGAAKAKLHLLKMAPRGLRLALQAAIAEVKTEGKPVRRNAVRFSQHGQSRVVDLEVVPLTRLNQRCCLIFFEAATTGAATADGETKAVASATTRGGKRKFRSLPKPRRRANDDAIETGKLAEARRELSETKLRLESMREAYEVAYEELQTSTEAIMASLEELQCANEELRAAKSEMESRNEELLNANDELARRSTELGRLNSELKNLHTSLQTAIVVVDRDLSVRSFTPATKHLFELSATDVGRPLPTIRHRLIVTNLEEVLEGVLAKIEEYQQEVRSRDGRWYSLRARPFLNMENNVDGVVLMLVDIDVLKRVEAQIAAARDYAEAILQTTGYPFVVLGEDLRVEAANAAFYNTFKVSAAETVGRVLYMLGNGQWNIHQLREFLEAGETSMEQLEVTHDFEHLGRRTMLVNAHRMVTRDGAPKRVLLAINDVSDGKQWEAVRRSEARYRRLFEAAKDGVLIVDPGTTRVTDANPTIMGLLGYAREELIGKELDATGLFPNPTACQDALRQLLEKGIYRGDQLAGHTKAGEYREFEVLGNLYEEEGRQVIQCNVRDVTERKQAEAALRVAKDRLANQAKELEETVAQRTAALRETMGELESFSYSIAHDLRAPLRAMQSFGHILEEEARTQLSEAGKDCVRRIVAAARRMDQLIVDVLNYSRVVRTDTPLTRVNLEGLLRGILESYLHLQPPAAEIALQGTFPSVLANEATLTLCFSNLLGNAVKFVAQGVKPVVRVWAETTNQRVRLFFADNGIGIPKEEQSRIFEMFQRLHRNYEGTGIGLAIVKKCMERMQGSVGLQSEPGKGSTFWLELRSADAP